MRQSNPVLKLFEHRHSGEVLVAKEILTLLKDQDGLSKREIGKKLDQFFDITTVHPQADHWKTNSQSANNKIVERAVGMLVDETWVTKEKKGNSYLHRLTEDGDERLQENTESLSKDLLDSFVMSLVSKKNHKAIGIQDEKINPLVRHRQWNDRVRIVTSGLEFADLKPCRPQVLDTVYDCLFSRNKFEGVYTNVQEINTDADIDGKKTYKFNPAWLVVRAGVMYLVATVRDYTDLRHFALHRLISAEKLDEPCKEPGMTLDDYLETSAFQYPTGEGEIKLELRVAQKLIFLVMEKYLSEDQTYKEQGDGSVLVTATLLDSWELRYWLLSLGVNVEIIGPPSLRDWIADVACQMNSVYNGSA